MQASTDAPLWRLLIATPEIFDAARGARTVGELGLKEGRGSAPVLLTAIASNSAYLARLMVREAAFLKQCLDAHPQSSLDGLIAYARAGQGESRAAMALRLRVFKRRAALLIALCDLGGAWPCEKVCDALTSIADTALAAALDWTLRDQMAQGRWLPKDEDHPERGSGLFYVAMGKHGARELNYSSDIDFSCYFDRALLPVPDTSEAVAAAVRITQTVVALLQEITPDGYVFRCDLRLRPDAGSTQIAVGTDAAELYYEAMGQNWERAAMIKARAVAGDIHAGEHFLRNLTPFVWRKYLDYAAIEDIHSIKRQIHAQGRFGAIAVAGHNVKLGRGGIREIEFFVQTQQLILGGRDPRLRDRTTLGALSALTVKGVVTPEVEHDLKEAYVFLRTLEHRLQMIEDEQTHTMPKAPEEIDNIARFLGAADTSDFKAHLMRHLQTVQRHYGQLFEQAPPLSESAGSLVFTGVDEDPETVETLKNLGFEQAVAISATIRGWHHGRVRATRSARAREKLTALMPLLLRELGSTGNPDMAFTRFDRFLSGMPSGVQVFALLHSNPHLLSLIASIAGTAPRLADRLAKRPQLFDVLTDAKFLHDRPDLAALEMSLGGAMIGVSGVEEGLDAVRRWTKDQQFRTGLQILRGEIDGHAAGASFAAIAEAAIKCLTEIAASEIVQQHGQMPGGEMVVVAMGKLGSREMTAASDLDLIFIYDHDPAVAQSAGARPQTPSVYYARLAQRLVTALTALTAEGGLFDVDMRLRPSGNKGPVAVSLKAFKDYQAKDAWTWERMALTRARIICGPARLERETNAAIAMALTRACDTGQVLKDVAAMRGRMQKDRGRTNAWDIKDAPGGLLDIEFIAQGLQLAHAQRKAAVLKVKTDDALAALEAEGILLPADAALLRSWRNTFEALSQILRLTTDGAFKPEEASSQLHAHLSKAGGAPFDQLPAILAQAQAEIRQAFERLIGPVAED